MLAADTFSGEQAVSQRRHPRRRSRRDRFARNLRRSWRRTRLRRAVISLILAVGAVWAGYKASMYVANQDVPSPDQVGVVGRGQ
jgi:hypothetical protein